MAPPDDYMDPEKLWDQLPADASISVGLRAWECADIDRCVGVRPGDGDCVCYGA